MGSLLWVAAGGATGAVLRYLAVLLMQPASSFPIGTLTVNVLGCLIIGFFASYWASPLPEWRLLFQTGVLGSFTTFSAFSLDTLVLWQSGQHKAAAANVLLNVVLCIVAVAAGAAAGHGLATRAAG